MKKGNILYLALSILWVIILVTINEIFFTGTASIFLPVFLILFSQFLFRQIRSQSQRLFFSIFILILLVTSVLVFPGLSTNEVKKIIEDERGIIVNSIETVPVEKEGYNIFEPNRFYLFKGIENEQNITLLVNPDNADIVKENP